MRPLKPFEGPSPTGFYNFNGKPLDQSEVDTLKANGVRIPDKPFEWNPVEKKSPGYNSKEWDIMPDNRLKDTKFRKKRLDNRRNALAAADEVTKQEITELWAEYDALPEPKPEEFEWMSKRTQRLRMDSLLRAGMHSTRDSDRIKALATWMEFERSRPKQVVENVNPEVRPATPDELLAAVASIFDKPVEYVREALMGKPQ